MGSDAASNERSWIVGGGMRTFKDLQLTVSPCQIEAYGHFVIQSRSVRYSLFVSGKLKKQKPDTYMQQVAFYGPSRVLDRAKCLAEGGRRSGL